MGSVGALIQRGRPNDATEWYVSGEGMWINQYLRGRGDFGELFDREKQMLKDLDTATDAKINDEVLYRSVDASAIFGRLSDFDSDYLQQYLFYGGDSFGRGEYADGIRKRMKEIVDRTVGKEQTEKGFMSTTTDAAVAENWQDFTGAQSPVVLRIETSKNTRGVNLSAYDRNVAPEQAQKERLLARNQSYRINRIYVRNGNIYVDVKMK